MAEVKITDKAYEQFDKLPVRIQPRVRQIFARLTMWPDVSGAKPLRGNLKGHYRIRTGDYRVRFTVLGKVVTVYQIGDRKNVYDD